MKKLFAILLVSVAISSCDSDPERVYKPGPPPRPVDSGVVVVDTVTVEPSRDLEQIK